MNKLAIIPIFFLTMCGTAPMTDPPAHACSLPLDGSPANCPDERDLILVPETKLIYQKNNLRGEIDITNPFHLQSLQMMFQRNERKKSNRKNATLPSDAINNALMEFNNGSNDPTKSEELLQLPSYRDQPSG